MATTLFPELDQQNDVSQWAALQRAQTTLIDMGYTFDVSETHHTVYKYDEPLFGLCRTTSTNKEQAMLGHWSAAIATASAHARIYRGHAPAAPSFE